MKTNLFIIKRFQGIRNQRTKTVEYGYLYVHFLQDTLVDHTVYESGKTIGLKIVAQTKKQAVLIFDKLIGK